MLRIKIYCSIKTYTQLVSYSLGEIWILDEILEQKEEDKKNGGEQHEGKMGKKRMAKIFSKG